MIGVPVYITRPARAPGSGMMRRVRGLLCAIAMACATEGTPLPDLIRVSVELVKLKGLDTTYCFNHPGKNGAFRESQEGTEGYRDVRNELNSLLNAPRREPMAVRIGRRVVVRVERKVTHAEAVDLCQRAGTGQIGDDGLMGRGFGNWAGIGQSERGPNTFYDNPANKLWREGSRTEDLEGMYVDPDETEEERGPLLEYVVRECAFRLVLAPELSTTNVGSRTKFDDMHQSALYYPYSLRDVESVQYAFLYPHSWIDFKKMYWTRAKRSSQTSAAGVGWGDDYGNRFPGAVSGAWASNVGPDDNRQSCGLWAQGRPADAAQLCMELGTIESNAASDSKTEQCQLSHLGHTVAAREVDCAQKRHFMCEICADKQGIVSKGCCTALEDFDPVSGACTESPAARCSPGRYSAYKVEEGSFAGYECLPCPAGSYCGGGLDPPMPCGAGENNGLVREKEGGSACETCDIHHETNWTGGIVPWGSDRTVNGDAITAGGGVGAQKCKPCEENMRRFDSDGAFCIECPISQLCGDGEVRQCPLGKRIIGDPSTGVRQCQDCPVGTFNAEVGSLQCLPCLPGHFNDKVGQSSCTACKAGTYQQEPGRTFCRPCGGGTYGGEEGSATPDSCLRCPAGTMGTVWGAESDKACNPCTKGTYSGQVGQTSCTDCPDGRRTASRGSTSLSDCTCKQSSFLQVSNGGCFPCSNGGKMPESSCSLVEGEFGDCEGSDSDCECDPDSQNRDPVTGMCEYCGKCPEGTYDNVTCVEQQGQQGESCLPCKTCRPDERIAIHQVCSGAKGFGEDVQDLKCQRCADDSGNRDMARGCFGMGVEDTVVWVDRQSKRHRLAGDECSTGEYRVERMVNAWDTAGVGAPWLGQRSYLLVHPFETEWGVISERGLWVYGGFPDPPSNETLIYEDLVTDLSISKLVTGAYSQEGGEGTVLYVLDRNGNVYRYARGGEMAIFSNKDDEFLRENDLNWINSELSRPHCDTVPVVQHKGQAPVLYCAMDDAGGASQLLVVRKDGTRARLRFKRQNSMTLGLVYDWYRNEMIWSFYVDAEQKRTNAHVVRLGATYEVIGVDMDELLFQGSISVASMSIDPFNQVSQYRMYFLSYDKVEVEGGAYAVYRLLKERDGEPERFAIPPIQTDWYVTAHMLMDLSFWVYQDGSLWRWEQCASCPEGLTSGQGATGESECYCEQGIQTGGGAAGPCEGFSDCLPGQYLKRGGNGPNRSDTECGECGACGVGFYMDVGLEASSEGFCSHYNQEERGDDERRPTKCLSCTVCDHGYYAPGACPGDTVTDRGRNDCRYCELCGVGQYIYRHCASFPAGGEGVPGRAECRACDGCGQGFFIGANKCMGQTVGNVNQNSPECGPCCPVVGEVAANNVTECNGLRVYIPNGFEGACMAISAPPSSSPPTASPDPPTASPAPPTASPTPPTASPTPSSPPTYLPPTPAPTPSPPPTYLPPTPAPTPPPSPPGSPAPESSPPGTPPPESSPPPGPIPGTPATSPNPTPGASDGPGPPSVKPVPPGGQPSLLQQEEDIEGAGINLPLVIGVVVGVLVLCILSGLALFAYKSLQDDDEAVDYI